MNPPTADSAPRMDLREDFAALVAAGERTDLARAALTIARIAYPTLDPAPSLRELDALAAAARAHLTPGAPAAQAVGELTAHLFGPGGFRGNTDDYYDPRNSFLNDVLARRTGIPISLAVVLIEIGARLGIRLEGVGFPGHFLVRLADPSHPLLLDPFFGGRVLDENALLERYRALGARAVRDVPPEALEPTPTPAILARVLRNLLRIYVERDDHAHALPTVDLLLVLLPDSAEELRLRGLLYEQLECIAPAIADLRRYLTLVPGAADADHIREHLVRLEAHGPTLH